MTKKYRFYKDESCWFIDLKWFPFNKAHLAMVCGADELLDNLSENSAEVFLEISTKPIKNNYDCLHLVEKLGWVMGAVYEVSATKRIKNSIFNTNQLWLCAVTLLVFGHYPKNIYFKKL